MVVVLLAGCTSDPSETTEPEPAVAADTGSLAGVVLDTVFVPVEGANVTIDGFNVVAITNADGAFLIEGLPLGSHFVRASHPDFHTNEVTATVVAGDPEPLRFSLRPVLKVIPFAEPFEFRGFLQCSYRLVILGDNCEGSTAEVTYPLEVVPRWVQSELQWSDGTGLGNELSFQYTVPGTTVDYIETEGTSPLTIFADSDEIIRQGIGDGLDPYIRVFSADMEGTEVPGQWGVGFQFDQTFTVYTHVFYGFTPPSGWTFLENGSPEPPKA